MEVTKKPIDIDDLFSGETIVHDVIKGVEVKFHFREHDTKTDLAYQRRSGRTHNRNGRPELTDEALSADLWLFDQVCTRVEVLVGESWTDVPDFRERIAPDIKRTALFQWRNRIAKGDEGN